ncbi:MAG: DNA-binding protein WhiA [Bacilli bacterium]|nr:DNA-binding protein WhiA [Bacilli bacterium]
MSYTTRIKDEISQAENTNSEIIAELSAFIRNNATLEDNSLYLTTENKNIAARIKRFITGTYDIKIYHTTKNNLNFKENKINVLQIKDKLNLILKDIGYLDQEGNYLDTPPTYIVGANEEIRAYLRGVFLSQGSINDPKTSQYHMELTILKAQEAVFIQKLLNLFDLNAKILDRDKGYMIYIKEAEKISDYLKILRANTCVMYFENIRIYHEEKNKTNRLNNCEQANIDKVVQTAQEQLKYIDIIEKNLGVDLLDDKTKEALEYRRKYPEASLKELSEIITLETGNKITKSGLNHRFRKIKELAQKF